jgi:hypothetical protein
MGETDEYSDMKRYVTFDIESCDIKEIDMTAWEEDTSYSKKEKPFSYESMLTGVMDHLEATGGVEFAILKDPELGRWWSKKVKKREENRKLKEAKEKLYATMTAEELKILGIRKQ